MVKILNKNNESPKAKHAENCTLHLHFSVPKTVLPRFSIARPSERGGGQRCPPYFGRYVNLITTRGGQMMPTKLLFLTLPRIFGPSYGPELQIRLSLTDNEKILVAKKCAFFLLRFLYYFSFSNAAIVHSAKDRKPVVKKSSSCSLEMTMTKSL